MYFSKVPSRPSDASAEVLIRKTRPCSAEKAFTAILSDERLGYVWLIDDEAKVVGYVVLTLRFGMEYGGLMACLDDLFVVPQSRNNGLTTAALVQVRDFCKSIGVRAITVEVSHSNGSAQTVYRRLGLAEAPDRQLLALALASPMLSSNPRTHG